MYKCPMCGDRLGEKVQECPSCNCKIDDAYDNSSTNEGNNIFVNLYKGIVKGLMPDQREMINLILVIVLVAFASTPILSLCSFHNTAIFLLIQALIAGLCMVTVVVVFFRWKNSKSTEGVDEKLQFENVGFWARRFDAIEKLPENRRMILSIILLFMIVMFCFCPFLVFDMTIAVCALTMSLIGSFFAITALPEIFRWQIERSEQLAQREREIQEMKMKIEKEAKEVKIEISHEEKKIDMNHVDELDVPDETDILLNIRDFLSFKILIASHLVTALWFLSSGAAIWYLFALEMNVDLGFKFILAVIISLITRVVCELIGLPFFIVDLIRDVRDELKKLNGNKK